jgi:hypothetical protein
MIYVSCTCESCSRVWKDDDVKLSDIVFSSVILKASFHSFSLSLSLSLRHTLSFLFLLFFSLFVVSCRLFLSFSIFSFVSLRGKCFILQSPNQIWKCKLHTTYIILNNKIYRAFLTTLIVYIIYITLLVIGKI